MLSRICVGIVILALAGCSSGTKGQLPTYKAHGTVKVDGKPFGPCTLTLEPKPLTVESRSVIGNVSADGTFASLRTYQPDDGIPEGTYSVKLLADAMGGPEVPGFNPITITVSKPEGGSAIDLTIDVQSNGQPSNDLPKNEDEPPPAI